MIKEYTIDDNVVRQLSDLLTLLKDQNEIIDESEVSSIRASQTNNLCYDARARPILYQILCDIGLEKKYFYHWFHMIDYDSHGYQLPHDHRATEDMSYILYLTTCEQGGETVLMSNNQKIEISPLKGKLVLFNSAIWHYGNPTVDKKKVAVGALKLIF